MGIALHRLQAQAGARVTEPARRMDVRVVSSTDAACAAVPCDTVCEVAETCAEAAASAVVADRTCSNTAESSTRTL